MKIMFPTQNFTKKIFRKTIAPIELHISDWEVFCAGVNELAVML